MQGLIEDCESRFRAQLDRLRERLKEIGAAAGAAAAQARAAFDAALAEQSDSLDLAFAEFIADSGAMALGAQATLESRRRAFFGEPGLPVAAPSALDCATDAALLIAPPSEYHRALADMRARILARRR